MLRRAAAGRFVLAWVAGLGWVGRGLYLQANNKAGTALLRLRAGPLAG